MTEVAEVAEARSSLTGTITKVKKKVEEQNALREKKSIHNIVRIDHIPHGFYEKELKSFFTQFGKVLRVKVARSLKTGNSKGYAFVEFDVEEVAQIAAETMNNYLMFERLIKCQHLQLPTSKARKIFVQMQLRPETSRLMQLQKNIGKKRLIPRTDAEKCVAINRRVKRLKQQNTKLKALGISYQLVPSWNPTFEPVMPVKKEATENGAGPAKVKKGKKALKDKTSPVKVKTPKKKRFSLDTTAIVKSPLEKNLNLVKLTLPKEDPSADILEKEVHQQTPKKKKSFEINVGAKSPIAKQVTTPKLQKNEIQNFMESLGLSPAEKMKKTPNSAKKKKKSLNSSGMESEKTLPLVSPGKSVLTPKSKIAPKAITPQTKQKSPKLKSPQTVQQQKSPNVKTPQANQQKKSPKANAPQLNQQKTPKIETPPVNKQQKSPKVNTPKLILQHQSPKVKTPQATKQQKTPKKPLKVANGFDDEILDVAEILFPTTPSPKPAKRKGDSVPANSFEGTSSKKSRTSPSPLRSGTPVSVNTDVTENVADMKKSKKKKSLPKVSPKMLRSKKRQSEALTSDAFSVVAEPALNTTSNTPTAKKNRAESKISKKRQSEALNSSTFNDAEQETRSRTPGNKAIKTEGKNNKTPKSPKFSPKLLRSKVKEPKSNPDVELTPAVLKKLAASRKSIPAKASKTADKPTVEKMPKFSPKVLRSRGRHSDSPPKTKKLSPKANRGRKSMKV